VNKDSTAFSAVRWTDVEDVLGYVNYDQPSKEIPGATLDLLHSQLLKIGVVFGSVSSGKRLQFISPILLEVCALFEGRVKIAVEEDLEGVNIHTNGHFEYVLELNNRKVVIVEAKKTDMEKGMAQALLGDETIADLDKASEIYAIVTNYREWYFGTIASKIYGILSNA